MKLRAEKQLNATAKTWHVPPPYQKKGGLKNFRKYCWGGSILEWGFCYGGSIFPEGGQTILGENETNV